LSVDYEYYPDEEISYGLCNQCSYNDGDGKCEKYNMPLSMCQRKKKCKYFHHYGTCWNCETFLEDFVIWDDKIKDAYEYKVCLNCGKPYNFGSKEHLSHIIFKMVQWRYPLPQDYGTNYLITRKIKDYIKKLRKYQEYYLSALKKWRQNN